MKITKYLVTILFLIPIDAVFSQCVNNPNNIYSFTYQTSQYELVKENLTWSLARNCAISRGGNLAIIESQAEQDTIFHHLNQAGITTNNTTAPDGGGTAYIWLSGNDRSVEGNWFWDVNGGANLQFWQGARNGSTVAGRYNNWGNEPDDFQGQDALGIALTSWPFGVAGEWNDVDELNSLYYLIEKPLSTGLKSIHSNKDIVVYPNPVSEEFTIQGLEIGAEVSIYDAKLELVEKRVVSKEKWSVSDYPKGIYFLQISGYSKRIKIVKI
jgi:hypothetical protein